MHRKASHAILMHRRGFITFRRGCVASQRVAGPMPIGPATRCDEIDYFPSILSVLGASQPSAAHRFSLLENRSSVASQLSTMKWVFFPAVDKNIVR